MLEALVLIVVVLLVAQHGLVGGVLRAGGYWLLGVLVGAILFLVGLALLLVLIGGVH